MPLKNYFHLFTGSSIEVISLTELLKNKKIKPVIKDHGESARLAGFGLIYPLLQQVYVHEDEIKVAKKVLSQFF